MLPPLYLQVLPCKSLAQRCKHACAAFQNACAALQTRLCSVPKRLFSVAHTLVQRCKPACAALYRTLVQRCRRLCSAPHLHSLLTEGSAAWAVALNPGAGPWPLARVLAGGLRLVTEGYSGEPALPPTPGGVTSGSPRGHQNPCNLQCILLMVFKNIVFYGVSCPLRFRNFILALSKNHAFYVVLGFRGGPGREKMTCWRCFNILRQNLSTWWGNIGPR